MPAGATDARFWMWNNYTIEEDWDFGFVEVSTDGGTTWTEQKVYDEAGTVVSTPDGYADPNGRMTDFGDKKYGLTGATDGWRHDYVDLTPFAGKTVKVRLRYATDAAFEDRGWFVDDFSLTNGGTTVWSDDAEANNGWTADRRHLRRHHRCRLGPRHRHVERQRSTTSWSGATSTGSTRACSTPTTRRTRRDGRVEGREDQVQRARRARLVPRHDVRQRQPRAQQPHDPAE